MKQALKTTIIGAWCAAVGMLLPPAVWADQAAAYYQQALQLKRQGQAEQAIEKLKAALAEREDYAAAQQSLGVLYRQTQQLEKAIYHLERAAQLGPNNAETHYSLGLAYQLRGRHKDAVAALERALALVPQDDRIAAQLGILLIRSDAARAVTLLSKVVAAKPADAAYQHQLGLAHRRLAADAAARHDRSAMQRHGALAEQHMLRALALHETAALRFDLGALYRRLDRLAEAIDHYQRAVELEPGLAAAWWDLGHLYGRAEQPAAAIAAFERYLELSPNSTDATIARSRITELQAKNAASHPAPKLRAAAAKH